MFHQRPFGLTLNPRQLARARVTNYTQVARVCGGCSLESDGARGQAKGVTAFLLGNANTKVNEKFVRL
jgi:hypothetical protein